MTYEHSNVYIVRVVQTSTTTGEVTTWYAGPYGSTRADQIAYELESKARDSGTFLCECHVEALMSNDECLLVGDYTRSTQRSLY